jgi:hypothetical protein
MGSVERQRKTTCQGLREKQAVQLKGQGPTVCEIILLSTTVTVTCFIICLTTP